MSTRQCKLLIHNVQLIYGTWLAHFTRSRPVVSRCLLWFCCSWHFYHFLFVLNKKCCFRWTEYFKLLVGRQGQVRCISLQHVCDSVWWWLRWFSADEAGGVRHDTGGIPEHNQRWLLESWLVIGHYFYVLGFKWSVKGLRYNMSVHLWVIFQWSWTTEVSFAGTELCLLKSVIKSETQLKSTTATFIAMVDP